MRAAMIFTFTVATLGVSVGDALGYGKELRKKAEAANPIEPVYGRPQTTYLYGPKPTPFGYNLSGQYPAYTAPHQYNPMLYPRFTVIPPGSPYPGPIPPVDESKLTGGSEEK
jgi:hypothetical protein